MYEIRYIELNTNIESFVVKTKSKTIIYLNTNC